MFCKIYIIWLYCCSVHLEQRKKTVCKEFLYILILYQSRFLTLWYSLLLLLFILSREKILSVIYIVCLETCLNIYVYMMLLLVCFFFLFFRFIYKMNSLNWFHPRNCFRTLPCCTQNGSECNRVKGMRIPSRESCLTFRYLPPLWGLLLKEKTCSLRKESKFFPSRVAPFWEWVSLNGKQILYYINCHCHKNILQNKVMVPHTLTLQLLIFSMESSTGLFIILSSCFTSRKTGVQSRPCLNRQLFSEVG